MIMDWIAKYGAVVFLVITCLEAMNCPGMPAGVVLPAAGIYAASGKISLIFVIFLTVIGGMAGTAAMYYIGRLGGHPLMHWLKARGPKIKNGCERCEEYLQHRSFVKIFIGRMLPVVRTLLPLPAGVCEVEPVSFLSASALGILCYNAAFVSAGYFLGHALNFAH